MDSVNLDLLLKLIQNQSNDMTILKSEVSQLVKNNSQLLTTIERLSKFEDKLDAKAETIDHKQIEEKVANLEKWRSYLQGAIAILSLAAGALATKIFGA